MQLIDLHCVISRQDCICKEGEKEKMEEVAKRENQRVNFLSDVYQPKSFEMNFN